MKLTNVIFMMALLSVVESLTTDYCANMRKDATKYEKAFETDKKKELKDGKDK